LLDAPPFTQCQNRMKHFLWNHKVTTLTAPPQLFQTFLPITNVEEAKRFRGRATRGDRTDPPPETETFPPRQGADAGGQVAPVTKKGRAPFNGHGIKKGAS
ncbi:MAG: hypothetical protein P4N60_14475, partial [Verrucomicrobiae bacterium]|nr:hypothetical protein [Verrucomicrobiae bacterium]